MITLLTSMATRSVLADLLPRYEQQSGQTVKLVAMGGVDAVNALQRGEAFDIALLSEAAVQSLIAQGLLLAHSHQPIVNSPVAVAVPANGPAISLSHGSALRQALGQFSTIGLSTGPSGQVLSARFTEWGLNQPAGRFVIAPPGIAVASLVAEGKAQIGFQQLSEMLGVPGIRILGLLPDDIQTITTFSAAISPHSGQRQPAQDLCRYLAAPEQHAVLRQHGLEPASP